VLVFALVTGADSTGRESSRGRQNKEVLGEAVEGHDGTHKVPEAREFCERQCVGPPATLHRIYAGDKVLQRLDEAAVEVLEEVEGIRDLCVCLAC
jgi:hypothetical protein